MSVGEAMARGEVGEPWELGEHGEERVAIQDCKILVVVWRGGPPSFSSVFLVFSFLLISCLIGGPQRGTGVSQPR